MTKRVLVLSPHPDDDAMGCGGAIRGHVVAGDRVKLVVLTSGEGGGHNRQSPEQTAQLREAEAADACGILGIHEWQFWREPDGRLEPTEALIARLTKLLEAWRPQCVYAPHPAEMHPDHRAAAELLKLSLAEAGAGPELITRLYEVWTPMSEMDEIVDISDFVEIKLAAIRAHQTQIEAMRLDEAILALNRYRGEMHSWPGGEFAEVFQALPR